jgi:predicted  nucleic acid-binding Zn-ribbon protein
VADVDKDLEKAVDEHLKRVYERYKSNKKVFDATHIGNIALAVIFLFAILLPYLLIQLDNHKVSQELEKLSAEIRQKEGRVETFREAMAGLDRVYQAVLDTPKPLLRVIQSLEEEAAGATSPSSEQTPATPDPCGSPTDKDRWMECRIEAFVRDRFSQYQRVLKEEVAAPLERLNIKELDGWKADVKGGIERLRTDFQKEVSENPKFWRTFDEESPIYQKMAEAVNGFWADHHFEEIARRMEEEAAALRASVEGIQAKQEQIKKRNEELNNRLKSLKTRFGKIGLQASQIVLLFPLVLAVVFLIATSNLCESIRLRQSFQKLSQRKDPSKTVITDQEVLLAAPLWIDPLDLPQTRTVRFAVLMIPAIVFVIALISIFYCWTIPNAFPRFGGSDYWIYGALYGASTAIFVFSVLNIIKAVRSYTDAGEATKTSAENPPPVESSQGPSAVEPKTT